jgi:hypothetical protein
LCSITDLALMPNARQEKFAKLKIAAGALQRPG